MFFNEIIKSENSSIYYNNWANYRATLTKLILDSAKDYYRLLHLRNEKAIRSNKELDLTGTKASLAIWGAGSCTDIDIFTLAKHFQIILIDCEMDTITAVRSKFSTYASNIICVDIPFWDIPHDTYIMYEAMLKDNTPIEQIMIYLDEHIKKMVTPDYKKLPCFDFSVASGLSSQLCTRFIALFSYYKHLYSETDRTILYNYISKLNTLAGNRLSEALKAMTSKLLLIGYELKSYVPETFFLEDKHTSYINDFFYTENISSDKFFNSDVDGNAIIQQKINTWVHEETARILTHHSDIWKYNDKKHYLMHFISLLLDI
ncbi:MAG: hypothetical protein K2G45_09330 [Lachnospiraceae bacterium]|nr:hypothetical protein [Lachnospiraceae bacterium]